LALAIVVPAQRIETETADRGAVKRVETAMDHLTVIEFGDPVAMAAAGSPLFKIERQGNKVFIQPLEPGASTNLFVWTASARFTYELTPAGSIETAHFAIDQQPPASSHVVEQTPAENSVENIAAEILLRGTPIRHVDLDAGDSELRINVTDVLQRGERLFIRYTIDNRSARPFSPAVPGVVALVPPRSPVSLFTWRYSQIGRKAADAIRADGRRPIGVTEVDSGSVIVAPGERQSCLLALDFVPEGSVPAVLELSFPSGTAEPIAITLVL
jgi:hypothetical protein